MTTHLEYVTGPLGEPTVLPCACGRLADHPRLASSAFAAASARPTSTAVHATGRRRRAGSAPSIAPRASRGRHAA